MLKTFHHQYSNIAIYLSNPTWLLLEHSLVHDVTYNFNCSCIQSSHTNSFCSIYLIFITDNNKLKLNSKPGELVSQ